MTSTGLVIAATRGPEVCRGDSGGPVVADGAGGPVLWGVAMRTRRRDRARSAEFVRSPASRRHARRCW
jgi:hypothetical protein